MTKAPDAYHSSFNTPSIFCFTSNCVLNIFEFLFTVNITIIVIAFSLLIDKAVRHLDHKSIVDPEIHMQK